MYIFYHIGHLDTFTTVRSMWKPGLIYYFNKLFVHLHGEYNKQLLDDVFVICRIINVEVRVISRSEGEADNSNRAPRSKLTDRHQSPSVFRAYGSSSSLT